MSEKTGTPRDNPAVFASVGACFLLSGIAALVIVAQWLVAAATIGFGMFLAEFGNWQAVGTNSPDLADGF